MLTCNVGYWRAYPSSSRVAMNPPAPPPPFVPETADLEPTPLEQRAGRASRLFWLWFAGTSSLISVGAGATLFLLGLSLRQLLVATGLMLTAATIWGFLEGFDLAPHLVGYGWPIIWFGGLGLGACVNALIERRGR